MRRLIYRPSAEEGLRWFFRYYKDVFPEGGEKAVENLTKTEELLLGFPSSGRLRPVDGLRERRISNTPFNLIYRVTEDDIEIISVRDTRSA